MLNGAEGIRQKQKDKRNDGAQRRLKIRYSKEKTPKKIKRKEKEGRFAAFPIQSIERGRKNRENRKDQGLVGEE